MDDVVEDMASSAVKSKSEDTKKSKRVNTSCTASTNYID